MRVCHSYFYLQYDNYQERVKQNLTDQRMDLIVAFASNIHSQEDLKCINDKTPGASAISLVIKGSRLCTYLPPVQTQSVLLSAPVQSLQLLPWQNGWSFLIIMPQLIRAAAMQPALTTHARLDKTESIRACWMSETQAPGPSTNNYVNILNDR